MNPVRAGHLVLPRAGWGPSWRHTFTSQRTVGELRHRDREICRAVRDPRSAERRATQSIVRFRVRLGARSRPREGPQSSRPSLRTPSSGGFEAGCWQLPRLPRNMQTHAALARPCPMRMCARLALPRACGSFTTQWRSFLARSNPRGRGGGDPPVPTRDPARDVHRAIRHAGPYRDITLRIPRPENSPLVYLACWTLESDGRPKCASVRPCTRALRWPSFVPRGQSSSRLRATGSFATRARA